MKFTTIVGTVVTFLAMFIGLFFLSIVAGAAVGAISGWVLQQVGFGAFLIPGFSALGVHITPDQLPAIGAVLGMVGSLFRSHSSSSSKS